MSAAGRGARPRRPECGHAGGCAGRAGRTAEPVLTLDQSRALLQAARESRLGGGLWQDHGLVFASAIGTPLDAANVGREFRRITTAAGLGAGWAPRDLRHTFVSLMSAGGVPIEEIALLAGHNRR